MTRLLYSIIVTLGVCVNAAPLSAARAQGKDSTKACDKAAKTVEKGHPAHKETAALNALVYCGRAGATGVSGALSQSRLENDVSSLEQFYYIADRWRDAEIMNAAMQLSRDAGAAVPARVFAVRHLLKIVQPGSAYSYSALAAGMVPSTAGNGAVTPPCRHGFSSDNGGIVGTPLPSDFASQIAIALSQLAGDASVPAPVRNAAECAQY